MEEEKIKDILKENIIEQKPIGDCLFFCWEKKQ